MILISVFFFSDRLSVDQALHHPWILQEFLENAPETSECLREFKYNNKWLVIFF